MPLKVGRYTLHQVRDGFIRIDGGAFFGAEPKVEWEKAYPADDRNRVKLAVRGLLVDGGERKVLVDTGVGAKLDELQRTLYEVEHKGLGLDAELGRAGVTREDVTDVVLTNLHFDHAGGLTQRQPDGSLSLAFPNATVHLQRRHWRWAHHPSELDAAGFVLEDFALLERYGKLHLIEGSTELYEGLQLGVSEGHTVGMQLVRVQDDDQVVAFCGDLIPTRFHLRPSRLTTFDLYPLTAVEEKRMLLAQAVEERWALVFSHDPEIAACRVVEEEGEPAPGETVEL